MTSDPGERRPINIESDKKYSDIIKQIMEGLKRHKASIVPVQSRLNWNSIYWRPTMQPCCNFPYCNCADPKYPEL